MMNRKNILAWVSLCLVILLFFCSFALGAEAHEGADRTGDLLDLLYRFMNFALLVIILFIVLRKVRVGDFFRSRSEEIQKKFDELRKGKEEAEKKLHELERKLKEFEEDRRRMLRQFQEEGNEEKEKIIAEAKKRAGQIVEQAELTVQQEVKTARDRLRQEIVALAAQGAGDIIAKQITEKDQDRLVDEFIEKVRKAH
jgi:F-type H+-transporting ATPase subunit b